MKSFFVAEYGRQEIEGRTLWFDIHHVFSYSVDNQIHKSVRWLNCGRVFIYFYVYWFIVTHVCQFNT